jgi:hypothetical protein
MVPITLTFSVVSQEISLSQGCELRDETRILARISRLAGLRDGAHTFTPSVSRLAVPSFLESTVLFWGETGDLLESPPPKTAVLVRSRVMSCTTREQDPAIMLIGMIGAEETTWEGTKWGGMLVMVVGPHDWAAERSYHHATFGKKSYALEVPPGHGGTETSGRIAIFPGGESDQSQRRRKGGPWSRLPVATGRRRRRVESRRWGQEQRRRDATTR